MNIIDWRGKKLPTSLRVYKPSQSPTRETIDLIRKNDCILTLQSTGVPMILVVWSDGSISMYDEHMMEAPYFESPQIYKWNDRLNHILYEVDYLDVSTKTIVTGHLVALPNYDMPQTVRDYMSQETSKCVHGPKLYFRLDELIFLGGRLVPTYKTAFERLKMLQELCRASPDTKYLLPPITYYPSDIAMLYKDHSNVSAVYQFIDDKQIPGFILRKSDSLCMNPISFNYKAPICDSAVLIG